MHGLGQGSDAVGSVVGLRDRRFVGAQIWKPKNGQLAALSLFALANKEQPERCWFGLMLGPDNAEAAVPPQNLCQMHPSCHIITSLECPDASDDGNAKSQKGQDETVSTISVG